MEYSFAKEFCSGGVLSLICLSWCRTSLYLWGIPTPTISQIHSQPHGNHFDTSPWIFFWNMSHQGDRFLKVFCCCWSKEKTCHIEYMKRLAFKAKNCFETAELTYFPCTNCHSKWWPGKQEWSDDLVNTDTGTIDWIMMEKKGSLRKTWSNLQFC